MELNKELITKETAAEIVQKFYNDTSDVPSKFLLSGVRCALLSAPPALIDFKFDKELVLAHLKRIEQEVYNSAGVPQEYFGGLKLVFQKAEEEILNEASPTT
jgi:hypothetical protein